MNEAELNEAARAMYEAMPSVKPTWDQLPEITRTYWRNKVLEQLAAKDN